MKAFDYHSPRDLSEVFDLISDEGAFVLAGGTDILLRIKEGRVSPKVLVDLKRVDELWELSFRRGEGLIVGATVTLNELLESPIVKRDFPLLFECSSMVGSYYIRNKATLVGNLCSGSLTADTLPALLINDAVLEVVSERGVRNLPLRELISLRGNISLDRGEIVRSVFVPYREIRGGKYYKLASSKIPSRAVFGLAYALVEGHVNIVLCDVSSPPKILNSIDDLKDLFDPIDERALLLREWLRGFKVRDGA